MTPSKFLEFVLLPNSRRGDGFKSRIKAANIKIIIAFIGIIWHLPVNIRKNTTWNSGLILKHNIASSWLFV
jgi:hypothetical protein